MTEKMKPSGIACIGDIPQDWEIKRLKYACKQITDGSHFSPDTVDDGKVYITVTDLYGDAIHTETAKRIAPSDFAVLVRNGCQPKKGDVLLSKDGTVGRSAIVDSNNDYVVLSSIGILTPGVSLLSRFLKYNLDGIHMQEQMLRAMDGSALKRITISKIAEFFAVIPPMKAQKEIADFLDTQCAKIDSVIADIEKQIETLQKYKKSLITETVTKGLDRSVPMKDSGVDWIGRIPSTWDAKRMKYFLSVASGDAITNDQLEDGDYPVFGGGKQMGWSNKYNVPENTILIGRVGANCGCVSITPKEAWATDNALIVSTNSYVKYVYYILIAADLNKLNDANAQPLITGAKVGNCVVPYTYKYEEQKQIADFLDSACSKIDEVLALKQQQLSKMQQHKKSLIYEYVTGKKRVTEVN